MASKSIDMFFPNPDVPERIVFMVDGEREYTGLLRNAYLNEEGNLVLESHLGVRVWGPSYMHVHGRNFAPVVLAAIEHRFDLSWGTD